MPSFQSPFFFFNNSNQRYQKQVQTESNDFFTSKLIQIESQVNIPISARYWMRDLKSICDESASSCWEFPSNVRLLTQLTHQEPPLQGGPL